MNSRMKLVIPMLSMLLAIAVCGQMALPKSFHDSKLGLTIHYPEGWTTESDSPVFDIVSFPTRERPPQMLVPPDGGEITIAAAPKDVPDVSRWMELDRIAPAKGDLVNRSGITTLHFGTVSTTIVRSEDRVIPEGRTVLYYFALNGRPVKVFLLYRGGTRSDYFESVAQAIIRNLEAGKSTP